MKISRFEELPIWQQARELYKINFEITSQNPFFSEFKFRDQIRSSCESFMDKIAEGVVRRGNKAFIQFLSVAKCSCGECRMQYYRAFDSGYINQQTFDDLIARTLLLSKSISGFISYLKQSKPKGTKYKYFSTFASSIKR